MESETPEQRQEQSILNYFSQLVTMSSGKEIVVAVRLYPSDDRHQYTWMIIGHRVRPYPEESYDSDIALSNRPAPDYMG